MTDAPDDRAAVRRTAVHRVVVGVDGSADAVLALQAAARAAAVLAAELVAITVWHDVPPSGSTVDGGEVARMLGDLQREAVDAAFADRPRPAVVPTVLQGAPAQALMDASRHADLLVIGARGRGGFPGLPLGSVALLCVLHAPCPVLVLRGGEALPSLDPTDAPGARHVVVGVDGPTPRSMAALRGAVRAAEELDGGLVVVSAWQPPDGMPDSVSPVAAHLEHAARERQDAALRAQFGAAAPVRVRTVLDEGSPAGVLVRESAGGDLLVVGSDSRNTMTGTLLGPVALTAVAHARCPVLVMRGGR